LQQYNIDQQQAKIFPHDSGTINQAKSLPDRGGFADHQEAKCYPNGIVGVTSPTDWSSSIDP
jgi:hypothetical protein